MTEETTTAIKFPSGEADDKEIFEENTLKI